MKTKMKKLISSKSIPILTLALFAGVVLMTGIVWAKSTKDTVGCEFAYAGTAIAKQWISDDVILHLRGITYGLSSVDNSGNMDIDIAGVCNHNRNLNTGDGNFWGVDETVTVTWEGLTGTFRGHHRGIARNWIGYSIHTYQGVGGDFEGMKLKLYGTWDFNAKTGTFVGLIKNPHGE